MNALLLFCAFMAFFYVPWDFFFKPLAVDEEVWFGFLLRGWAAKLTEPLHWLIYLAGSIGLWKMKPWVFPWASLYSLQVAIGMFVWNYLDERGSGLLGSTLIALPFLLLAAALWKSRLAPPASQD
tara:strand:+ start:706 stop:1080 length:375 start_codon:yes stop_codon:yes gene_type:complete